MLTVKTLNIPEFETVIEAKCEKTGLHAFIAIHDTHLGPALGGVRFYPYSSPNDALIDVLRLAKAMSYKSAAIQDGLGGGKSVIIGDPKLIKNRELLHSFAEMLNSLNGRYIAAEDVGISVEDMSMIGEVSPFVAGLATTTSCGDPSRFTAHGVFKGIQAVAKTLWGSTNLNGKKLVVQGLGNVGMKVAELLFWEKAVLMVADPDQEKISKAVHEMGAIALDPNKAASEPCDIFVPCAMGGVINQSSIQTLNCLAIAGGANNQLATPQEGLQLFINNILYAPDFIINAGGIINAAAEFEPNGYNPIHARNATDKIFDTLMTIFDASKREGLPPHLVANQIAEYNMKNGIGKRIEPIHFSMV